MNIDIQALSHIARAAGQRIMEYYGKPGEVAASIAYKADNSPITAADKAAHDIIWQGLAAHWPALPLISEEGQEVDYETRRHWARYWLVDPLDGTKEFINQTGNFAVNIALIEQGFPTVGVVYLPATDVMYLAAGGEAYKQSQQQPPQRLQLPAMPPKPEALRAVRSKSHASEVEQQTMARLGLSEYKPVGSAVKYCLLAEGSTDIYFRANPNSEWDSAAGQAIIEQAGGHVLGMDFRRFAYNKPSLVNPPFICTAFSHTQWLQNKLQAIGVVYNK